MLLGSVKIKRNAVVTHRDTYFTRNLSVVSVRRPFLISLITLCAALAAFTASFYDLLFTHERYIIITFCVVSVIVGTQIGQLKLLSRDLKGSELSGVVWGRFVNLNHIRKQIVIQISNDEETSP